MQLHADFFLFKKDLKKVTKSIEIITFAQNLQKNPLI